MPEIIASGWVIRNGLENAVATGASTGYSPVFFPSTDINLGICVLDNNRVFLKIREAGTSYNDPSHPLSHSYNPWKIYFYASTGSFKMSQDNRTITTSPSNTVELPVGNRDVILSEPSSSPSAKASWFWTNPNTIIPDVGSTISEDELIEMGFVYAFPFNQMYTTDDGQTIGCYVCGFIDILSNVVSTERSESVLFTIGREQIFPTDYFPWERRIDNDWYSLNREETGAGLYRMIDGNWTPLKNGGETNHAFKYNNEWNASPKSGLGA